MKINIDIPTVLPLIALASGALLLLLTDLFSSKKSEQPSLLRILIPMVACVMAWFYTIPFVGLEGVGEGTLLYADKFSFFFNTVILFGTVLTVLFNHNTLKAQAVRESADIDVLVLLASLGALVMASSANLVVTFVGFELLSVAVYALTGVARREKASSEAALKYFLLGAFSSAFLLYGMTLVFGATGSMFLPEIAAKAEAGNTMLLVGVGLLLFGFGFKVSLVPFHFWAPDAYQGAPTSLASYMAVVVKAAAIACFLRVLVFALGDVSEIWEYSIWALAMTTMTVGNLVALRQRSIKRMLAYSSVAHAGYAMLGFFSPAGIEAVGFYMLAYACMTMAAFGVVLLVTKDSDAQYDRDDISSMAQIGWTHPFLGVVMTIAIFSLAGIPPLAGFVGKFYLFSSALNAGYTGLVIVAAMNSVLSLYYYLRVLVVMYFSQSRDVSWEPSETLPLGAQVALMLATVGTIYFGLFSDSYLSIARATVSMAF